MAFWLNGGDYTVTFDRYVDTSSPGSAPDNFFATEFVGDYLFSINGTIADPTITRTDNSATYSNTGILRTGKFSGSSKYMEKKLVEVSVITTPLASGAAVDVTYQLDDSGSFSSALLTHDTDDATKLVSEAINSVDSFGYIQFQLNVTGLVELLEFTFVFEEFPNQKEG